MISKTIFKRSTATSANSARKYWSEKEDNILINTIKNYGSNWLLVAQKLKDRNPSQCAQRWKRIKPIDEDRNQKWTKEEDVVLTRLTVQFNCNWKLIADQMTSRTSRQIRERYVNHLDPNISTTEWTVEEDTLIWTLYQKFGTKWSAMSKVLVGRPENRIKNRFYSTIRKKYGNVDNPYYIVPKKSNKKKQSPEVEAKIEEQIDDIPIIKPIILNEEQWQISQLIIHQEQLQSIQFNPNYETNEDVQQNNYQYQYQHENHDQYLQDRRQFKQKCFQLLNLQQSMCSNYPQQKHQYSLEFSLKESLEIRYPTFVQGNEDECSEGIHKCQTRQNTLDCIQYESESQEYPMKMFK